MRAVTIVVLGKYPDVFSGFKQNVERFAPLYPKVFVRDGLAIPDPDPSTGWTTVQGPDRFSMAGNANLGWRSVPKGDILYVGDDVRFSSPESVALLASEAESIPSIGILSPRIVGPCCNPLQNSVTGRLAFTERSMAFICVYLKRELIDAIGYLDERFCNYGFDDNDYCRRAQLAGFKLAMTPLVTVEHLGHATFSRGPWINDGEKKFVEKWGSKP